MRIAVISDIHGNFAALSAVLADIESRGVDATIGLGDFVSGPFDPRAVVEAMIERDVPAVRGNHDRWLVDGRHGEGEDWAVDVLVRRELWPRHMDWLRALPATRVFDDVFMCHATPASDTAFWMDELSPAGSRAMPRAHVEAEAEGIPQRVIVCGHTHIARTLRLGDGRLVVNPGPVGLPFLHGSPDARYAVLERRNGDWRVDLVAIPYDRTVALSQAHGFGFPGFATAIETGWATLAEL
jgi:putative phosphoesterase